MTIRSPDHVPVGQPPALVSGLERVLRLCPDYADDRAEVLTIWIW